MMVKRIAVAALLAAPSLATAFTANSPRAAAAPTFGNSHRSRSIRLRTRSVECAAAASSSSSGPSDNAERSTAIAIPPFVASPVLAQVYPSLVAHKAKFGNPNIPLGSSDGKKCKTLRRLHFQNKLSEEETALLTELGFVFHSFEDVYYECDFDEMMGKLADYRDEFDTYQIPKKYEPDPELGAWVTMLRRLRRTNDVPQLQIDKLDAIGFEWISTRKCGSSFMAKYRDVLSYLSKVVEAGGDVRELVHEDTDIMKWINAQRLAYENGNLSESRADYMDDLPGIDWRNPSSWA